MIPRLNDPVHYVSYGTPGGEYPSTCRAATVTGVPTVFAATLSEMRAAVADLEVDLFVMNPSGLFFNRCRHDESFAEDGQRAGGTWHYPDNCPN